MTLRGMWQADPFRTSLEANFPLVLLTVVFVFWKPQDLVSLGWLYILMLIVSFWMVLWPPFRLRRSPGKGWVRWKFWGRFFLPYFAVQLVLNEIGILLLFESPVLHQYPELYQQIDPETQRPWWMYLIGILSTAAIILAVRIGFWGVARFLRWINRKLVRQFTLSHIGMLVMLFWILVVALFVYQVSWGIPREVEGINEVKETARWTAPLLTSGEKKDWKTWLKQVEQVERHSLYTFVGRPKESRWRVYDRQGHLIAWTGGKKGEHAREEKELVRRMLNGEEPSSLGFEPSTYMAAAPVRDSRSRVVGAVVQIKVMEPLARFSTMIHLFLIMLAVSLGGVLIFLLLVLFIASVFAYMRARALTRRFQLVAEAASRWSDGDLKHRIPSDWPDELGLLSQRLNHVAASLEEVTEKLAGEKEQVESLLQSKRKLVANVSHELRTPVAILRGHLDIMEPEEDSGQASERWRLFRRELDRLQRMIDELFYLSTQEDRFSREAGVQMTRMEVEPLIAEVVEALKPIAWRERKITIGSRVSEGLPSIWADPVRVRQILHNLIRNALRHTQEGGLIFLSADRVTEGVRLTVADTGKGMSEEEMSHVFERYYRGHVIGGFFEGAGLGLALVKEWSEKMGARIEVRSKKGEGTRVSLTFTV